MLSKKQARTFFLSGTILFSALFLYLTYDTIVFHVDKQTNAQNLTAEVVRGKYLFDQNNCMGCHTILGEGAYYAPDLTRTYIKRGPEWIKVFMKDPQAMFPGERKMTKYDFSEQDHDDMIAFLKWISEMDLNGFPADPDIGNFATAPRIEAKVAVNLENKPAKWTLCFACHAVGGEGGNIGPALDGVGLKYTAEYLDKWIKDPQTVKPGTTMPVLPLTDAEVSELVNYLSQLK